MTPHNTPTNDSSCPAVFVTIPAVVGALLWLWVMLTRLPQF